MPWRAQVLPDHPIVEIVYEGTVTADELGAAAQEGFALSMDLPRPLALADCTGLSGGHSVVNLYFVADMVQRRGISATFKEAVLLPALPEPVASVRFWEDACLNRGMRTRVFDDREEAIAWLLD